MEEIFGATEKRLPSGDSAWRCSFRTECRAKCGQEEDGRSEKQVVIRSSIKHRIHMMSIALNMDEPQYQEEDIKIRTGFEVASCILFDVVTHCAYSRYRIFWSFCK